MAFTTKVASCMRAIVVLLCKLLLVDVMCSFVCDWLFYLLIARRNIAAIESVRSLHHPSATSSSSSGIEVILCGISRSGSMSLAQAMEILGFPCFHGVHWLKPTNAWLFKKADASGEDHDWQCLLHGHKSIADFPAASAYKTLMKVYPNAKVILNVRDPEKWYKSFSNTILLLKGSLEFEVIQPCTTRLADLFLHKRLLKGSQNDKDLSIANYKLHIEDVKKHVPSHKLHVLELEKQEGWAPLCNFLEVPIPPIPFPFVNNTESFQRKNVQKFKLVCRSVITLYLALLLCIILNSWKWALSK